MTQVLILIGCSDNTENITADTIYYRLKIMDEGLIPIIRRLLNQPLVFIYGEL